MCERISAGMFSLSIIDILGKLLTLMDCKDNRAVFLSPTAGDYFMYVCEGGGAKLPAILKIKGNN